jgi:hypothetical protein
MRVLMAVCGLVLGLALGAPVLAQESEVIFSRKAWQVELVEFDDGSVGCVSHVTRPRGSFSIWIFEDDTARLQFYSDEWQFEAGFADLQVQIDRRGPWTLTNAELFENSVLFDLPNGREGVRFMREVAGGNTLFLRDDDGVDVRRFTLAGSAASMRALGECGEDIVRAGRARPQAEPDDFGNGRRGGDGRKKNPFD